MKEKRIIQAVALLTLVFTMSSASANWNTKRTKDPMGGPASIDVCTISTNSVAQDFPYNRGRTTARLCVSKSGDEYETYLTLNQGQLMCQVGSETFMLRADEKPAKTMYCSPTVSGTNEQAYFTDGYDSVSEIASAKKIVRIKVNLYSHGAVVFEFKPLGRALPKEFSNLILSEVGGLPTDR